MRIYKNFEEAMPEVKRDVVEMGIKIHPETYQDQNVSNDPDFETLELQNYTYTVTRPRLLDLGPTQPWADQEWNERMAGIDGFPCNPGHAWKSRSKIWRPFLDEYGKFSYSYSERLSWHNQVLHVIHRLRVDPDSRQLFISIWDTCDSRYLGGISRVPCSLGYLLQCRRGSLNMTYLQRSADLVTHFVNDIYLAMSLLYEIAGRSDLQVGTFTHWVGSLHMFKKDAEGVF